MKNTHHTCTPISQSPVGTDAVQRKDFITAISTYCHYQKCKKVNIDHLSLSWNMIIKRVLYSKNKTWLVRRISTRVRSGVRVRGSASVSRHAVPAFLPDWTRRQQELATTTVSQHSLAVEVRRPGWKQPREDNTGSWRSVCLLRQL